MRLVDRPSDVVGLEEYPQAFEDRPSLGWRLRISPPDLLRIAVSRASLQVRGAGGSLIQVEADRWIPDDPPVPLHRQIRPFADTVTAHGEPKRAGFVAPNWSSVPAPSGEVARAIVRMLVEWFGASNVLAWIEEDVVPDDDDDDNEPDTSEQQLTRSRIHLRPRKS